MATYMTYCRNLGFDEAPNYAYLRRLFRDLYNKCQFEFDFIYDWTVQKFRPDMPEFGEGNQPMYEEAKGNDGTSTVPESLRAHHGFGSERAGEMRDSASNDNEAWARQQEEVMQDAEKRVVDRAE